MRFRVFLAAMAIFIINIVAVHAAEPVCDYADLLTSDEEQQIETKLLDIRTDYNIDAAVVTVPDLNGYTAQEYADDFYDYNGYGIGEDYSGILLLISENPREYHITTTGKCIKMFNDSSIDYIGGDVVDELRENNYYGGAYMFAEDVYKLADTYSATGRAGAPRSIPALVIAVLAAIAAAAIATVIAKSTMKNAVLQANARNYVSGGPELNRSRDIFLYSTVTKTPKVKANNSSTHMSSSGRTHGGGGGSY